MTAISPDRMYDCALTAQADHVNAGLAAQDQAWGTSGWTRRRFIAGAGMVGAAALASQLVTSRAAFAATPSVATDNTVIVVFMRGAADGLRILAPNCADLGLTYLREVREPLVPGASNLIALPGQAGWGVNAALRPLYDGLWNTGELAFVPAVSSPGISRSHFQAQQYLEKGGSDVATTGWLDRLLTSLGPGTTFRAVSEGLTEPMSMSGGAQSLLLSSIERYRLGSDDALVPARRTAIDALYRGVDGPLAEDVPITLSALSTANAIRAQRGARNGADYPAGPLSDSLMDFAAMLRAEVGLQVGTIDVGGWDTHTDEVDDLDASLAALAASLQAFMTDLGPTRRKRVTVVVQTEFGRRVATNGTGGSDHGHGSLMWLLGGGLSRSGVFGQWNPLSAGVLDEGDVPGLNSPFAVFGEVAQKRLNVGSLSPIFPGQSVAPLGLATAA